jgi:phage virion morphogenesis protein
MTGATITVDSKTAIDGLQSLYKAAGNLKPVLKNIGEYEAEATKQRIRDERSPDGTPFAPLNPFYALTKKGLGILRGASGDLADIIWQLGDSSVEIGSSVFYAVVHQEGRVIKPKTASALMFSLGGNKAVRVKSVTIPARPFVGISAQDEAMILEITKDFFGAAVSGKPFKVKRNENG